MITISKTEKYNGNKRLVELRGLSTDEKPTSLSNKVVENGSIFIEIDTGKIFMYDLENEQWKEM